LKTRTEAKKSEERINFCFTLLSVKLSEVVSSSMTFRDEKISLRGGKDMRGIKTIS